MMRRPLTTLMLVLTCGALVLGTVLAMAIAASTGSRASASKAASVGHSWNLSMSAAPDDLTLAEVNFGGARRVQQIAGSSLHVVVRAPFGDDYLTAGALRLSASGALRVLVLLVNRPSPLFDPVSVGVRLTAPIALRSPLVLRSTDPLARPTGAHTPALCDLTVHGSTLSVSRLRVLSSRGQALAGFDAEGALAQAYDLACGLSYLSSFKQAVEQPAGPVGKIPDEGCKPEPGYACPLAAH